MHFGWITLCVSIWWHRIWSMLLHLCNVVSLKRNVSSDVDPTPIWEKQDFSICNIKKYWRKRFIIFSGIPPQVRDYFDEIFQKHVRSAFVYQSNQSFSSAGCYSNLFCQIFALINGLKVITALKPLGMSWTCVLYMTKLMEKRIIFWGQQSCLIPVKMISKLKKKKMLKVIPLWI